MNVEPTREIATSGRCDHSIQHEENVMLMASKGEAEDG